jgi:hypothetical protein
MAKAVEIATLGTLERSFFTAFSVTFISAIFNPAYRAV